VKLKKIQGLARTVGRRVSVSTAGFAFLCGLAAHDAWPQDAAPHADQRGDELQEIVVTAEKRDSTVQKTPFSITALAGDALLEHGITSMEEIVQTTPGLSMRTSSPGETELEMRGLSSSGGAAPTVGFYLDETPLTSPAAALVGKVVIDPDLFDLNRVEVLRGPQGTLYGAGSMGGTVKLVTNAPTLNRFEGVANARYSNTSGGGNNGGGNAMLNLPLVDDKLAVRIVGTDMYTSGWIDRIVVDPFPIGAGPPDTAPCGGWYVCARGNVAGAPVSKIVRNTNWNRVTAGRLSLLFQPTDTIKILPLVMSQHLTAGGYSQYDSPPGTLAHYQPFDASEPLSDRFTLYSLTVTGDFPGAQLTSASSYYSRTESQTQDAAEVQGYYFGSFFSFFPIVPSPSNETDVTIQRSQELRLASTGDGRWQWIVGGFVSSFQSVFNYYQPDVAWAPLSVGGAAANPLGLDFQGHNLYDVKQDALFGETSYQFTDAIKGTVGLRWFKFDTRLDYEESGISSNSGNATPYTGSISGNARGFNPKFNLAYLPTKDVTLYAEIAKGFRPGGVNLPVPVYTCGNIPLSYSPDSIWNYEAGEKARLLDGKVTINSDLYYIQWKDVQQYLTIPQCGFNYSGNAGNARAYGPEVEVTALIIPEVTFALSGTYTKSEITSVAAGNQGFLLAANQPIQPGTPLENVPEYTVGGSLTYKRTLFTNYIFMARVADNYVGTSHDLSYYFEQLPGYNLIDLRLGVSHDRWRVNGFVTNLGNKVAQLSINTNAITDNQPALTRVSTNQPRTVGMDLTYSF
jgi:iron complex outermembrane receptor protein